MHKTNCMQSITKKNQCGKYLVACVIKSIGKYKVQHFTER